MIATPGEESSAAFEDSNETESQTTSEQQKGMRENTVRSFGAAREEWKAPAAIDTTSLKHLSYNNSLTSPMTPMTGKSGNSFSPSGAFQSLNLDSSANESDEEMDDEDLDEDADGSDKTSCFSGLKTANRAVMNLSRSHVKKFYFSVFPEAMEMDNATYCVGRIVLPTQYDKSCLTLTVTPCGRKLQLLIRRPPSTMSPEFVLCLNKKTIKNKSKWQDHALVHAINSHFKELKLHSEDKIAGKIIFKAPFELEPQTSPELLMHRDADGSKVGHVTTIQHYDQLKKLRRMKKMEAPRKDREYTRQTIRSFIFVAKKRSDGFNESKNVREADSSNKIKKPDKKPQAPEAKKRSRPSSPSTALTATTSSISARSPSPV